jgi:hypothetical protein
MSEFSESYHVRTNDTNEGVEILRRAKRKGYVFPASNGWVTFVAEKNKFEPDSDIVASNRGLLLHYVSAEDHGWSFSLFEGNQERCRFSCQWENEVEIDPSRYSPESLSALGIEIDSEKLVQIVSIDTIDAVFDYDPSKKFAELVGLPHYEWLAFDYVARDLHERDGEWPDAIEVI